MEDHSSLTGLSGVGSAIIALESCERIVRVEHTTGIEKSPARVPQSQSAPQEAKMTVQMPPQNMVEGKGSRIDSLDHAKGIESLHRVPPRSPSAPQESKMPAQMPDPPQPHNTVDGQARSSRPRRSLKATSAPVDAYQPALRAEQERQLAVAIRAEARTTDALNKIACQEKPKTKTAFARKGKGSSIVVLEHAKEIKLSPFNPGSPKEPEEARMPSQIPDPPQPHNTVDGQVRSSRPRRSSKATSAPVDAYQSALIAEDDRRWAAAVRAEERTPDAGNKSACQGKPKAKTSVAGRNGTRQREPRKNICFITATQRYRPQRTYGGKTRYFGSEYVTEELAQIGLAKATAIMKDSDGLSEEEMDELVVEARTAAKAAAEEYVKAHPEKFMGLKMPRRRAQKRIRRDSNSIAAAGGGAAAATKRARRPASESVSALESVSKNRATPSRSRRASSVDAQTVPDGSHPSAVDQCLPAKRHTLDISHFAAGLPSPESSETYVEETAWRLHNPPLPPDQSEFDQLTLTPLPPPPDLPKFPSTGHCEWTWHEDSRVLHGNFRNKDSGAVFVSTVDEAFLLSMMERDDISVISEGLADDLDPDLWNPQHLGNIAGRQVYHKFRKFERKEDCSSVEYDEVDKCVSMKVEDYVRYLDARQDALSKHDIRTYKRDESTWADTDFTFYDGDRRENSIDVIDTVLYMIDFDIIKLLPTAYKNFASKFKLPGILPGGKDCMMNAVNDNGRPFMGPNLYVTPPASFTHFHQDGHGTVDSGHQCLSGYNEVVMLRRLPESHKKYALYLLSGSLKNGMGQYDALYGLPHGDGVGAKPIWPECDSIERCREMGYCPSVFILKPGQLVHINKGRLHAFRKMAPSPLPEKDCHAMLRGAILHDLGGSYKEEICVSVAWDWMYRGMSSEGINREIVSMLECAALNRNNLSKETLAIPEHSILQMAQQWSAAMEVSESSWTQFSKSASRSDTHAFPPPGTILKGILPSLRYVVGKHAEAESTATAQTNPRSSSDRVSVAKKPNSWENPDAFALDPYGNGDFFCRLCQKELSNVYMHCDGCEKILHKDYNICVDCHTEERYKRFDQMHPLNGRRHSTTNHTGNFRLNRQSRCPCKNGPCCKNCGYCAGCSCRCHKWFTLNYRFTTIEEEKKLLEKVEAKVGDFPAHETTARLGWIGSWNGRGVVDPPGSRDEDRARASSSSAESAGANESIASDFVGDTDSPSANENELAAASESSNAAETSEDTDSTASSEKKLAASNDSIASESAEHTDLSASSDNELAAANQAIAPGSADEASAALTKQEMSTCEGHVQNRYNPIVLEHQTPFDSVHLAPRQESSASTHDSSLPSAQRVDECIVVDPSGIQQEVEDADACASA